MTKHSKIITLLATGAVALSISGTASYALGPIVANADTVENTAANTVNKELSMAISRVTPIDVNVAQVDMDNAEMLQRYKLIDPIGYSKIPQPYIKSLLMENLLDQGTTKYIKEKHGHYRIYINSAIVKGIKAGYLAVAVGSAIASAISSVPSNRGAWFEFSKSGLVKMGKQWICQSKDGLSYWAYGVFYLRFFYIGMLRLSLLDVP